MTNDQIIQVCTQLDGAMSKLYAMYPELTDEGKKNLEELTARIKSAKDDVKNPKPLPEDAVLKIKFKTEKLRNLQEILVVYKKVILPALIRREAGKLNTIKALLESQLQSRPKEEPSTTP